MNWALNLKSHNNENVLYFLLDLSLLRGGGWGVARPKWQLPCIFIEEVQVTRNIPGTFKCILNYFNLMSRFVWKSLQVYELHLLFDINTF